MPSFNLSAGWGALEAQVAAATKNTTGKIFVVAASTVAGYDKLQQLFGFRPDPEGTLRFYNTIDAAVSACTANRGDVVLVAPGHAETLTTAGAIALDVAGVSVIGLGNGDNRPVITFGSTDNTASITISADDCALKNVVLLCNDDGLTNALNVTGNDADIDVDSQDTSAAIEFATVIRLDTADNAKVKLRHLGFAAGNAMVSAIRLDDCDNVRIDIDGYGVLTTAWVEMVDVASSNVTVNGRVYTSGITGGTRNVVDTITGSTWDARIWDASAAAMQRGGSGEALAFDDVGDIASALALATQDSTANSDIGDQVGNKTDTAVADTIEGNAMTTQSLNRMVKAALQRLGADSANNTAATTLVAANDDGSVLERLEGILQRVSGVDGATNVLGADDADNLFASTNVAANRDGSILERLEDLRQNESATGGLVYQGSTDAGMGASTVTVVSADLAGQTDDYFNTKYYMMVLKNTSTPGGAPENEVRQITDYVSATGTFTVTAFSVNVEASDEILVMHESLVLLGRDDANNTMATTNVVANADGSVLERLETVQQAVGGVDSAANVLGADNANNAFASTNVAANGDGSVLERLETIQAAAIVIDEFHDVPAADNVLNAQINEVIGNKADAAAAGAVTATDTLVAYTKQLVTELQVVDEFHDVPLADSAANSQMNEVIGNKTDTNAGNSLLARHLVQTADAATNANMRDVVGNKADAAAAGDVSAVESIMAYAKQAVTELSGTAGITTFPAAAAPANGVALADVLREVYDQADKSVVNTTATLVDGTTIFTVAGGPIEILSLVARCVTGNDGTASTLQWRADPTDGALATFSGASASLAGALAGATVALQGSTLATVPLLNATGVNLGQQVTNGIVIGAGVIQIVIGAGSTTGTWQHHMRYRPLSRGVVVS